MASVNGFKMGQAIYEWTVNRSRANAKSPTLKYMDNDFFFQIHAEWGGHFWLSISYAKRLSEPHNITVNLVNGDDFILYSTKTVLGFGLERIWYSAELKENILKNIPDFRERKTFIFMIEMDFGLRRKKTDNKAVETPLYFDHNPCLESLSQDFCKLLEDHSTTPHDITVTCEDLSVQAHRTVLSSRSEVFAAMLNSDMLENRTGTAELDMDPAVFQEFVRYLYTGETVELNLQIAKKLYEAGDKYSVFGLVRKCVRFFSDNLSRRNACEILVLADTHSDQKLKDKVITFILVKKIYLADSVWVPFYNSHPLLAVEVLNRFAKLQN